MQRQSLGSPSSTSKLFYGRGGGGVVSAAENGIHLSQSPSSSSVSSPITPSSSGGTIATGSSSSLLFPVDDEEIKLEKPHRCRSSISKMYHSRPERFIHLIPMLLLLCLLILYLCSHEPSATDLAGFNGFRHPSEIIESTDIHNMQQYMDKGKMIAIHSRLRNLQEIRKDSSLWKPNRHRKLADF